MLTLSSANSNSAVDSTLVNQIVEMGFPSDVATFALSKYKLDLEQAMDYLFSKDMSLI